MGLSDLWFPSAVSQWSVRNVPGWLGAAEGGLRRCGPWGHAEVQGRVGSSRGEHSLRAQGEFGGLLA